MKCHKPNTDQEATLTVYANGFACPENILPLSINSDPNVLECFIPVSNGDKLTIVGHFSGTVLHGSFDLLADGSFLGDKRIEGAKDGDVKYFPKRKLEFTKFFDTPRPVGYTSIYTPREVIEGDLQVKALEGFPGGLEGDQLGVGSLAVVVSVNQKSKEQYHEQYSSTICGEWKREDTTAMGDGGIAPTQQLQVQVTDDNVHQNRQSKHRRHFTQTRFGEKPWAKFIFYYRSQMAMSAAGCISRPDKSQALEPGDANTLICASTEKKSREKKDAKQTADVEKNGEVEGGEVGVNSNDQNDIPVAATPVPVEEPMKKKKKKLLGQSLLRTNSSENLFMTPAPAESAPTSAVASFKSKTPFEMEEVGSTDHQDNDSGFESTISDNQVATQDAGEVQSETIPTSITRNADETTATEDVSDSQGKTILPQINDEEHEDAIADAELFPAGVQADDPAAVAAVVPNSVDGTEKAAHITSGVQEDEVYVKEDPQNVFLTSMVPGSDHSLYGQDVEPRETSEVHGGEPMSNLQKIRDFVLATGSIDSKELLNYFEINSIDRETGLGAVDEIALCVGTTYVLKTDQKNENSERPIITRSTSSEGSNVKIAKATELPNITIKTEPISQPSSGYQTSPVSGVTTEASSPRIPATPTSLPAKRTGPNDDLSREGTPSKKARIADLRAKKAVLEAKKEEKQKQVEVARKAVEAQQRLRAEKEREQEESLEREIEMLEKQNAEEDEELAALNRAKELEEEEMLMEEDMTA